MVSGLFSAKTVVHLSTARATSSFEHQATSEPERAMEVDRRYGMLGRTPDELIGPTVKEWIGADRHSRARLSGDGRECSMDLVLVACGQYPQFPTASFCRRLRVPRFGFGIRITRIDEYGECGRGRELGENLHPLRRQNVDE